MLSDSHDQDSAEGSPEQNQRSRRPQRKAKHALRAAPEGVQAQKGPDRAQSPVPSQGDALPPTKQRLRTTGRGAKGAADRPGDPAQKRKNRDSDCKSTRVCKRQRGPNVKHNLTDAAQVKPARLKRSARPREGFSTERNPLEAGASTGRRRKLHNPGKAAPVLVIEPALNGSASTRSRQNSDGVLQESPSHGTLGKRRRFAEPLPTSLGRSKCISGGLEKPSSAGSPSSYGNAVDSAQDSASPCGLQCRTSALMGQTRTNTRVAQALPPLAATPEGAEPQACTQKAKRTRQVQPASCIQSLPTHPVLSQNRKTTEPGHTPVHPASEAPQDLHKSNMNRPLRQVRGIRTKGKLLRMAGTSFLEPQGVPTPAPDPAGKDQQPCATPCKMVTTSEDSAEVSILRLAEATP